MSLRQHVAPPVPANIFLRHPRCEGWLGRRIVFQLTNFFFFVCKTQEQAPTPEVNKTSLLTLPTPPPLLPQPTMSQIRISKLSNYA